MLPLFCQHLLQSSLPETEFTLVKNKVKAIFADEASTVKASANGADEEQLPEKVPENSKAYLLGLIHLALQEYHSS